MKKILVAILVALLPLALFADELIIFSAPGCLPCARFKKMLEENPELLRGFKVSRVDIAEQPETAELFAVASAPTIVRLDDMTHEVSRKVGFMNKKEMQEWLNKTSKNK